MTGTFCFDERKKKSKTRRQHILKTEKYQEVTLRSFIYMEDEDPV